MSVSGQCGKALEKTVLVGLRQLADGRNGGRRHSLVLAGLLEPVHGDEDRLGLVAACEHDGFAQQAHFGDDLGHVRAGVGHAHLSHVGLAHALRIHTRSIRKSVALYNKTPDGKVPRPP